MHRYILSLSLLALCTGAAHAVNSAITVSVTVAVKAIDIDWAAACWTGTDNATVLNWALGNQIASISIDGETSGNYPRTCTVRSIGADVTVKLKCSDAVGAGANDWTIGAAAGANVFRMQAKGGSGTGAVFTPAYANLTTSDQLLIPVLANAATSTFYLKFYTPTASTDTDVQTITVTATATSPP
ncbi:MAG: hypothetical protein AAB263_22300 [Planctomycetota bacterium]